MNIQNTAACLEGHKAGMAYTGPISRSLIAWQQACPLPALWAGSPSLHPKRQQWRRGWLEAIEDRVILMDEEGLTWEGSSSGVSRHQVACTI